MIAMPEGAVPRVLEHVGLLALLSLVSTFAWWAAANMVRAEYRSLMSAVSCASRIFFYSICLLCILVALKSFHLAPSDPRDTLFGWIHVGVSIWVCGPSAWRSFRTKGPRLVGLVLVGWLLTGLAIGLGMLASPGFKEMVLRLPRYLTTA